MKKIYSLFVALATTTSVYSQTVITQWNFDGSTNAATTGSGAATIVVASGIPSFPSGNPGSGKSWSVSGFPAQGSGSGTAGFKFAASTVGYTGISVSLSIVGSNTSSKYFQMQYTINGTDWDNVGIATEVGSTSGSNWTSMSNAIPPTANNNIDFAVRIVSVFNPSNNNVYTPIRSSSNYATAGAIRVDNVTISGTGNTLAVSNINNLKYNFIKNTFIKDGGITFGTPVKDVKVYNIYGQIVKTASIKENATLNVSELQKGNYFVTGIVNGQPISQKVLID
ncbi:T9SS type A sorting domain-containing protein [Chryseobacterium sp. ISL-6]|uniref:T9SS type A sorting domain-containing protein n=1 Tax=Chryseobacterium sp. ISL-6 TaxID=2819143 RepID=UPI001BE7721D|nr:T9SS type A sorting domain-containing protein [Chryseobacterium sp. ISL-6]MBT2623157.1 T9SS type A sorting domain-containing protein [Chryseobacterium sp. ISL-6]